MSEQRPTLYDQIGGTETLERVIDNVFDVRLPNDRTTEPPIWDLFYRVSVSPNTIRTHKATVASFIGTVLGGPELQHPIDAGHLSDWHADARVSPGHFDLVMNHFVEAFREEAGPYAEEAIEALQAASAELRPAVVTE